MPSVTIMVGISGGFMHASHGPYDSSRSHGFDDSHDVHGSQRTFIAAYAKINLTLDILGKRDDGYHRLASVMQTVALHDTIAICGRESDEISCVCDVAELQTPQNLALRAAQLLRTEAATKLPGVALEVHKEIPMQAGLGGGSSDAATVLTALTALWELRLPPERLEALGARLGSDVPFFVHGGTALIEGRGEFVTPLPDAEPLWLILVKPAIGVPTPIVFRQLTSDQYTHGEDTEAVVSAIRERRPLPDAHLTNALEPGVMHVFPEVAATRDALREAGAPLVRMSGSGPTLYAPFRELSEAAAVYERLRLPTGRAWLTHTVPAVPRIPSISIARPSAPAPPMP